MRISIKSLVTPNIPLSVLLILVCTGIWICSFLVDAVFRPAQGAGSSHSMLESYLQLGALFSTLTALGATLFNTFLIAQINTRFTIIRNRSFLPILLFIFLMSTLSETHSIGEGYMILTLVHAALFYIFTLSRDRNGSEQAFMGTLLISIAGILCTPLLWLIPVCWVGIIIFQSLSLRTFLASIFGALAPWLIYLPLYIYFRGMPDWYRFWDFYPSPDLQLAHYPLISLLYLGTMLAILLVGIIGVINISASDAIHTRNKLNFLIVGTITLVVLSFLYQTQLTSFVPVLILFVTLLLSHPFTLAQNNFYSIVFIVLVISNLAFAFLRYILI